LNVSSDYYSFSSFWLWHNLSFELHV
jgi:hypothetical protein